MYNLDSINPLAKVRPFGAPMLVTSPTITYTAGRATVRIGVPSDEQVYVFGAVATGGQGGRFNVCRSLRYLDSIERVIGNVDQNPVPLTAICSSGLMGLQSFNAGDMASQPWHGGRTDLLISLKRFAALWESMYGPGWGGDQNRLFQAALQGLQSLGCCQERSGFLIGGTNGMDLVFELEDISGDDSDNITSITLYGIKVGGQDANARDCSQHNTPYWLGFALPYTNAANNNLQVSQSFPVVPDQANYMLQLALTVAGPATPQALEAFSINLYSGSRGWNPVNGNNNVNGQVAPQYAPAGVLGGGYGRPSPRLFSRAVNNRDTEGYSIQKAGGTGSGTLYLANQYVAYKPGALVKAAQEAGVTDLVFPVTM